MKKVIEISTSPRFGDSPPRWDQIVRMVCRASGITEKDLVSSARSRTISRARHLVCYIARKHSFATLAEIGKRLGGRDHSTVLYGIRKFKKLLPTDEEYKARYNYCVQALEAHATDDWNLQIVDQNSESSKAPPTLRVSYRRPDGSEWVFALPMTQVR